MTDISERPATNEVMFVVVSDPNADRNIHVALVRAAVLADRPELCDERGFLKALVAAVTEWTKLTDAGRDTLNEAAGCVNIGDLALVSHPTLHKLLATVGIYDLQIDTVSADQAGDWRFDDSLVKED
jgi:hypothetical protein